MRLPTNRPPTPPGEMLREEFLLPYDLTQAQLAECIGVTTETVNRLVNGKRNVSTDMALRLAAVFGTTPEFWIHLQAAHDLWHRRVALADELSRIERLEAG